MRSPHPNNPDDYGRRLTGSENNMEKKIKLITDSGSDISFENEKRYGIQVLPFGVSLGGRSYTSRVDLDNDAFYALMDAIDDIPATSQITPFEFTGIFEEHYRSGCSNLIYTAINSAGSATYGNAVMAAGMFYEEHPEAEGRFTIHLIDSGTYSGCYGYAVVEAAKQLENGCSAAEAVNTIRDWCENVAAYFVPYSLKYAVKSGRLPVLTAHMANALGIRPLLRLFDHRIETAGKVRSEKNIVPEILKRALAEMEPGSPYCVFYGNDAAVRDEMAAAMTSALGYPPADAYQIGAVVAANAGPKIAGVAYRAGRAR